MRIRKKGLLIVIALVIVVIASYILFGRFSVKSIPNERFDKLPVSEYISIMDSSEKHVWFYLYNNNDAEFGGLREDDVIERIYIAENGKATVYKDTSGTPTIRDFEGLSDLAIVQRIESNMIPDHNFEAVDTEYTFLATPAEDNEVQITIDGSGSFANNYNFSQTVTADDLVTDVAAGTLRFCGYLHQSESVSIFNKYQTVALLTPIELQIDQNNIPSGQ